METIYNELLYLSFLIELQIRQIFFYWAIGIIIGSLVSVFLKKHIYSHIVNLQNNNWGIFGIIPAAILGILSPLCMYGTVPIVASLAKSGMKEEWIASFMMSSVLLNPQLLFYSLALGNQIALLRLILSFFGGCIAGLCIAIFYKKEKFYTFTDFEVPEDKDTDMNLFKRLIKNIIRNIKITFPYLLLGIIITALYQRYIPVEWLTNLFGANHGLGSLMAAALGVPLYTCGGGTIPLLFAWLNEGMSKGSAIAFMIAGPATKLTNLGALKIVLGYKNFLHYVLFSIVLAALFGIFTDLII